MSKNRDLIYDMAEAPETEDFEQLDSEPLQLGGVGEDAPAAVRCQRLATCTSRRRCPRRATARCASLRCVCRT